jgi:hypothetical protein
MNLVLRDKGSMGLPAGSSHFERFGSAAPSTTRRHALDLRGMLVPCNGVPRSLFSINRVRCTSGCCNSVLGGETINGANRRADKSALNRGLAAN